MPIERKTDLPLRELESLVKEIRISNKCSEEEKEDDDIDLSVSRLFKMKLLVKNFHQKTLGSHLPSVMDWNVQRCGYEAKATFARSSETDQTEIFRLIYHQGQTRFECVQGSTAFQQVWSPFVSTADNIFLLTQPFFEGVIFDFFCFTILVL